MKKLLFISTFILACNLNASVTLSIEVGALRNALGLHVPAGSVALLVADFSNDGVLNFANTTLSVNSFVGGGTDDRILGVASVITASEFPTFTTGITYEYSGNFSAGDFIYVAWFPTISTIGATVSAGTSYGLYRTSSLDVSSGSDIAWIAPVDGFAGNLFAYDNVIAPGAVATTGNLTASLTAIPEPSSFAAFAGLAMLGTAALRRRKHVA